MSKQYHTFLLHRPRHRINTHAQRTYAISTCVSEMFSFPFLDDAKMRKSVNTAPYDDRCTNTHAQVAHYWAGVYYLQRCPRYKHIHWSCASSSCAYSARKGRQAGLSQVQFRRCANRARKGRQAGLFQVQCKQEVSTSAKQIHMLNKSSA